MRCSAKRRSSPRTNWRRSTASGIEIGSVLENGVVRTPPGFREAYRKFVEGGWNGLTCEPEIGGQGLPLALAVPLTEMWNSACMGWALCPLLNSAAQSSCCSTHGSPEAEAALSRQAGLGRMAGHDEPDRAAGRFRSRRAQGPRGAGKRPALGRALPDHRTEDLHHLRRPRPLRQHRPHGAGAPARRAAGEPRHLAISGAEIPPRSRRQAGRAQRHPHLAARGEARHPRLADLRALLRRGWRGDRLAHR